MTRSESEARLVARAAAWNQTLVERTAAAIISWQKIEQSFDLSERAYRALAGWPLKKPYQALCTRCGGLFRSENALREHDAHAHCKHHWKRGGLGQPNVGLCVAVACRALCRD